MSWIKRSSLCYAEVGILIDIRKISESFQNSGMFTRTEISSICLPGQATPFTFFSFLTVNVSPPPSTLKTFNHLPRGVLLLRWSLVSGLYSLLKGRMKNTLLRFEVLHSSKKAREPNHRWGESRLPHAVVLCCSASLQWFWIIKTTTSIVSQFIKISPKYCRDCYRV